MCVIPPPGSRGQYCVCDSSSGQQRAVLCLTPRSTVCVLLCVLLCVCVCVHSTVCLCLCVYVSVCGREIGVISVQQS